MNPLSSMGQVWGTHQTAWIESSQTGLRWQFLTRSRSDAPTILAVSGTKPECVRTAKMARVEAVLVVCDVPLSAKRIAQLATVADAHEAKQLIDRLNAAYDVGKSTFRIERVASGFRLLTKPIFSFWLGKLHQRQAELTTAPAGAPSVSRRASRASTDHTFQAQALRRVIPWWYSLYAQTSRNACARFMRF